MILEKKNMIFLNTQFWAIYGSVIIKIELFFIPIKTFDQLHIKKFSQFDRSRFHSSRNVRSPFYFSSFSPRKSMKRHRARLIHFRWCIQTRTRSLDAFISHHAKNEPYKFALTTQLRVWAQVAKWTTVELFCGFAR